MRNRCLAILLLTSVMVAGCAYAPSGTLVEALEPENAQRATLAEPAAQPRLSGQSVPGAPVDLAGSVSGAGLQSLPPPTAYGPTGAAVAAVPGKAGPLGAGQASGGPDTLLSRDQADATRDWLKEIARTRSTGPRPHGSTTASQLRELRENHGSRAISEIEADAAD